jgi:hypothetical protein
LRHKDWPNARDSFQQIFDGHNPAIAVCLGFICDQKASTLYKQEKEIEYYTIALTVMMPMPNMHSAVFC